MPSKVWKQVVLDKNIIKALEQIDAELEYSSEFIIQKTKQRCLRLHQTLKKMRKLQLSNSQKLVGVKKKIERRERSRELKAEKMAKLEISIEKELLNRLKLGLYPTDGILNDSQKAFTEALDELQVEHDEEYVEEDESDYELEEENEMETKDMSW
jgi:protein MAK16